MSRAKLDLWIGWLLDLRDLEEHGSHSTWLSATKNVFFCHEGIFSPKLDKNSLGVIVKSRRFQSNCHWDERHFLVRVSIVTPTGSLLQRRNRKISKDTEHLGSDYSLGHNVFLSWVLKECWWRVAGEVLPMISYFPYSGKEAERVHLHLRISTAWAQLHSLIMT